MTIYDDARHAAEKQYNEVHRHCLFDLKVFGNIYEIRFDPVQQVYLYNELKSLGLPDNWELFRLQDRIAPFNRSGDIMVLELTHSDVLDICEEIALLRPERGISDSGEIQKLHDILSAAVLERKFT